MLLLLSKCRATSEPITCARSLSTKPDATGALTTSISYFGSPRTRVDDFSRPMGSGTNLDCSREKKTATTPTITASGRARFMAMLITTI